MEEKQSLAVVSLKKGEGRTVKAGGAWIFDNEIESIMGHFENGDVVLVRDFDGYPLGKGFINQNSKIRIRMLTRRADQPIDRQFLRMRVKNAWEYRKKTVDTSSCRLIFGVTNIVLTFYAYTHMHLATATAIVFTRPLFTIPLAALMLKENVGWKRGVATLIGFIGIVMVLNPGPMGLSFPETAALGASFMLAVTYIYIQKLSRTENHLAMLLYFGLACSLMTAYPAYCQWTSFGLRTGICLLIIAGTATAAQYCVIRAYQIGKATVISPIDYLQIPLSAFIGWCFFHETLSLHFIAGVIIIIATSVYILKRRAGD